MEIKLCKDCKHCKGSPPFESCEHSKATNLIDGQAIYLSCRTARDSDWIESRLFGHCGQEARWWEAKNESNAD